MKVYLVQHTSIYADDDEDVKIIGIYSSAEEAKLAIANLIEKPGFAAFNKGFHIDEYELGQTFWQDGF